MDIFIARQPIFDAQMSVFGYELLHRSNDGEGFEHDDPDRATVELMDNSLLVNRLEDLTDGKLGFVNVPRNLLVQDFLQLLPAPHTVIEVLETVRPEPVVIQAVQRLKKAGYTIALDDFVDQPGYAPLIRFADIIKVDFLATDAEKRREIMERHKRPGLKFLAEKVETREHYDEALESGYDLFQGYFFCRPETSARRALPRCKINYVQFLREISNGDLSLDRLERVIKSEMSLSAKLLRYLNSVRFGVRREITSIHQALVHMGERPIRRWGTLIALAGLGDDKPLELVRTCLVRARFCEQMADRIGRADASLDLYLTGLFSAIDALLDRPLEEALKEIGLSETVCSAIHGDGSILSRVFSLAVACERGDLPSYSRIAASFGLPASRVAEVYADAMFWADGVFTPSTELGAA